ncbi:MAG: ribosome silencing factor [Pseudomonadota bacterium]|jgi:ribosome-associated protein
MDIRKLQRAIVDGLEDVKAQDIVVFNTEHLSPLFERVVIASGTSNRQTKALAASVRDRVKAAGGSLVSMEGEDNGEWIIVDCGAAVAHIMQPAIRQYYHLEEIWGGKAVRMKLAAQRGLAKASEGAAAEEDDGATSAVEVPARKAAPRKRGGSAAEAVAVPARKRAPARKAAAPAGAVPAAKKAPARKTAPRKTAAQPKIKTVVVNPPTRKTAKTPARKRSA